VIFFFLPVYMTLLMTAWGKSKFTILCKHVIKFLVVEYRYTCDMSNYLVLHVILFD